MPANRPFRQINSSRILREIWIHPGIRRIDLARRLNLDKATVSHLVNKMLRKNILEQSRNDKSSSVGGLKTRGLNINTSYGFFLGIEVQPQSLRLVLVDLQGNIVDQAFTLLDLDEKDLTHRLVPHIEQAYYLWASKYSLLGVGISIPGLTDPYNGRIIQSVLLDRYIPMELTSLLNLPCPVLLDNDANCSAWGELVAQKRSNLEDFLFVLVESDFFTGTNSKDRRFSFGMSLVMDGKVHYGRDFSAGEFRSIKREIKGDTQFSMNLDELSQLSSQSQIRNKLFSEMGEHLAFLANCLNLTHIIIGGDMAPYWPEFKALLDEEIQKNWSYPNRTHCCNQLAGKGKDSAAYGAAAMHLERVFADKHAFYFLERGQKIGFDVLINKARPS